MSKIKNRRLSPGWATVLIVGCLLWLGLLIRYLLSGYNVSLFNPMGAIAQQQHNLFVLLLVLLCAATIPVVLLLYFIAWKFRDSNTKAIHSPTARHGKSVVFTIWAYPILFFVIFAMILIPATQRLEPRDAIVSNKEPLKIQVIALQWKWVFLYPDQDIATVNNVQLPKDRPVIFELTADDAPMSSFWIPNIGGQLYAMTGHVNRLNLMPTTVGEFRGSSAEINGAGFAGMKFKANVTTESEFNNWVEATQQTSTALDAATYANLVKPSEDTPAAFYGSYQPALYDTVVMKYMGHSMQMGGETKHEGQE